MTAAGGQGGYRGSSILISGAARLQEVVLHAIRRHEVHDLVVKGPPGDRVYISSGADHPCQRKLNSVDQWLETCLFGCE